MKAVIEAHPYEEPVIDVIEMKNLLRPGIIKTRLKSRQ